jgi:murein L,D-transpeptidase YcbB/YkuD
MKESSMRLTVSILLLLSLLFLNSCLTFQHKLSSKISERCRSLIEKPQADLHTKDLIESCKLYKKRSYKPVWISGENDYQKVVQFMAALKRLNEEGLEPMDYKFLSLKNALSTSLTLKEEELVNLELTATYGLQKLINDCYSGKVKFESDRYWSIPQISYDIHDILESVQKKKPSDIIQESLPSSPGYKRLKKLLVKYRRLQFNSNYRITR